MAEAEVIFCRRCHRRLKNEETKKEGIGKTCKRKEEEQEEHTKKGLKKLF